MLNAVSETLWKQFPSGNNFRLSPKTFRSMSKCDGKTKSSQESFHKMSSRYIQCNFNNAVAFVLAISPKQFRSTTVSWQKTYRFFQRWTILPLNCSSGHVNCSLNNPFEFNAKPSKPSLIKVQKWGKLKTKCSKNHIPQVVVLDTQNAILRNFSEIFP